MINRELISLVEKNYSTTPLLIASDLRDINRLINVDVVGYYFRGKRILDIILESCTGSLKLYFANESDALRELYDRKLLPINIRENIEILYIEYTNQLNKKIFNGHAKEKFLNGLYRLENVIRWFIDVVYPRLVDDDYYIIFESENTDIPRDIFNKKTIDFNNLTFGQGTTRTDDDEYLELNAFNPYLHLYAVTKYTFDIIGALEVYPLSNEFVYEYEVSGRYDDLFNSDAIPYEFIRDYSEPGNYKIFVDTIVTHPRFRGKYSMLRRLFERYINLFISLSEEGIYISDVYGDAWTEDGKKLAEYYQMKEVRKSINGILYKLPLIPPPKLPRSRVIPSNIGKLLDINKKVSENMFSPIFISYNHNDKNIAKVVKDKLELNGFKVIIDYDSLITGGDITAFINDSIRQSGITLSLISAYSLKSSWVAMETITSLYNAIGQGRKYLPCNLDGSIFDKNFTDESLDVLDKSIIEIDNIIAKRLQLGRGIEDLQEERSRINRLKNELPFIIGKLKQILCADLSPSNFDIGIVKLISELKIIALLGE